MDCDYDPADVYNAKIHVARKQYQCEECGITIQPGQKYERVFGIWKASGDVSAYFTCTRCLDLRLWVKAHVPCMCWSHGNMREDVIETAEEWCHEAPGLLFGALRREVLIRRKQNEE